MKRILIVEDDALLNKTLAYNLSSDDWDVTPRPECQDRRRSAGREVIRPGAAGHQSAGRERL